MQTVSALLGGYRDARYRIYRRRISAGTLQKLLLAVGMAVFTGLAAQLRVPLPFSPVPITGQTFAVLLAGILLGETWGGVSMGIYLALGVIGVPWFTGWGAGIAHLAGPTGGYILGFVLAALFIGYVTDNFIKSRRLLPLFGLMLVASFIIIYGAGLSQLYVWLNFVKGSATGVVDVLYMGLLPFIGGDVVKAAAAATLGRLLLPREK